MEDSINLFALICVSLMVTAAISWLWLVIADRVMLRRIQKNIRKKSDTTLVTIGVTGALFAVVNSLLIDEAILAQSLTSLWGTWLVFWVIWYILLFFKKEQSKDVKKFLHASLRWNFWYFGAILFAIYTFTYSIYIGLFS